MLLGMYDIFKKIDQQKLQQQQKILQPSLQTKREQLIVKNRQQAFSSIYTFTFRPGQMV